MARIDISAQEFGTTRVFSLSMLLVEARALKDDVEAQASMLGAKGLNPAGIEVFPIADLGDIGLADYLREGTDAHDHDIKRDAAKLAALDGWVMLVHSSAFQGDALTLVPDPALTLIGTYAQTPSDKKTIALRADAAQRDAGTSNGKQNVAQDRRGGSALVVAGLIVVSALILWWAL